MKQFLLALVFVSVGANAASVKSAAYDAKSDTVILDVVYSGGCEEHDFSLEFGPCMETYPGQIRAKLLDPTQDACDAIIHKRISLPLDGMSYCRPGYLTIKGDGASSATVLVPEK